MTVAKREDNRPGSSSHRLNFRQLPGPYAITRPLNNIPQDSAPGPRWICLKLEGPFPFSQTGVLLSFIAPLSNNGLPIFAVSTYDTDYVLIPEGRADRAVELLRQAGHELFSA